MQNKNGGIPGGVGTEGHPVVFDKGQTIFGFLSLYEHYGSDAFLDAASRAGMFLVASMDDKGRYSQN